MCSGIDEIELGLVVSLGILSAAMEKLSVGGTRWWLASDPRDAVERGYITVGFGYPECDDPLNASFYQAPVLNSWIPPAGVDDLALLWDSNVVSLQYGEIDFGVFAAFFGPIKRELVEQLRSQDNVLPRCRTDVNRPNRLG